MTTTSPTLPFDLRIAKATLAAKDERLARLIEETVEFQIEMESMDSPYEALMESITYQSISGKAAATIFAPRQSARQQWPPAHSTRNAQTPPTIAQSRPLRRKSPGHERSRRKNPRRRRPHHAKQAEKISDDELVERLVSVRGIGAWTVEMFLIFHLGRPDVLPIHDLGVKKGWSVTYGKKRMPKPKELLAFGERWRPYRTIASWYMWRAFERAGYKVTNKIAKALARRKRAKLPAALKARKKSRARKASTKLR